MRDPRRLAEYLAALWLALFILVVSMIAAGRCLRVDDTAVPTTATATPTIYVFVLPTATGVSTAPVAPTLTPEPERLLSRPTETSAPTVTASPTALPAATRVPVQRG